MSPKAFISHATEDKGFAEPFATALREKGVDAWLDKWEVLAGNSLPQKIFGALDCCEFVVAVLSPYSVKKPWVSAELDLAVVKRIEGETRIIPVKLGLDRHEMPPALRSIRWVSVADPTNIQAPLEEVLDAIYQRSSKPPLGLAPGFTDVAVPDLPGVTQADVVVLKILFKHGAKEDHFLVGTERPKERAAELGISGRAFLESLEVLRSEGYLTFNRMLGGGISVVQMTWYAIERCCEAWVTNYAERVRRVTAEIGNSPDGNGPENKSLAEELGEPIWLITHVFDGLADRDFIKLSQTFVGYRRLFVWQVSPQLRRQLRD